MWAFWVLVPAESCGLSHFPCCHVGEPPSPAPPPPPQCQPASIHAALPLAAATGEHEEIKKKEKVFEKEALEKERGRKER